MRFVVLTGLSGAGKTQALHALEDIGYYCVDNLPPVLLRPMAELCARAENPIDRVAVVVDIRGGVFFGGLGSALEEMRRLDISYEILFLDASDDELVRRYNETRRAHPFGSEPRIAGSIAMEREKLAPLRAEAHRIIDTTRMLTRELRESIIRLFGGEQQDYLKVALLSFGYKKGLPQDADLMLDVRFLPNPFYIAAMRPLTGLDQPVIDYLLSFPETGEFLKRTCDLLEFLMPLYRREGKSRLVIAIGCTGGQHRSVLLSEELARRLHAMGYAVSVSHRDKP